MKDSWEYKRLGDIAEIKGGKRLPKGVKLLTTPTKHPYIRVADFNDFGTIDTDDIHYISDSVYDQIKRYIIKKEDVYISIAGTIGKSGIIPDSLDGANLTENACRLILSNNVYRRYVYYFTISPSFIKQIDERTKKSAQPKLALTRLSDVIISYPTIKEQQSIVDYLDSAFAKIDAMKANAEKALSEAKALFQASLKEMFEPKEGWEKKTLPEISENLDSIRKPVAKNKRAAGIYPYYGASGIVDYVDDYLFDEDLLCVSEDGANLLMRTYPIAFPISGKVWVNNHAHVLRFKSMITQKFVEYYFSGMKLDEYITGAAQPKLTQKALNSIIINMPISLEKQQSIVEKLDSLKSKVDRLQENYDKISQECDALKQAILRQVFE